MPLIHQVVVAQLAAARQGTHATKTRAEVRGGGTKPYRQKGTGRARQGSIRAPQYVGGGVVHGPHPRGYAQRTPKKMIAAALRGALSDRARDGRVHVVSDLVAGDVPSTKSALTALAKVAPIREPTRSWWCCTATRTSPGSACATPRPCTPSPSASSTPTTFVCRRGGLHLRRLEAYVAGPAKGKSGEGGGYQLPSRSTSAGVKRQPNLGEAGIADLTDAADDDEPRIGPDPG